MGKLTRLSNQFFFGGDYVPNPEPVIEIIDSGALLNEFIVEFQQSGGDIDQFSESEWTELLQKRFGVDEEDVADFLEKLASFGVVDNEGEWQ
ncbi:MAG: hypothetical protein EXQ69_04255 [Acidimicrobiia bacterium]|nr:hypothetical protein [Acidimicrobiia bacterium]